MWRRRVGWGTGAEVVPDAVEIDALAALDEALFVGAPEGEVPEAVVFDDVVPGGDAGEGSVHDDEALDFVGVERGVGVGDHDADVVRDDEGAVEAEGGDDGANVGGLCLLVVAAGGAGGAADAAEVGHDDGVVFDEFGGERRPGVAGFGVAVNEDDDGALAGGADEDVGAGGTMDDLGFEGGGVGLVVRRRFAREATVSEIASRVLPVIFEHRSIQFSVFLLVNVYHNTVSPRNGLSLKGNGACIATRKSIAGVGIFSVDMEG